MNRFIQIQEELISDKKAPKYAGYKKYSFQKDVPTIEMEPLVITVSKSKRERILKRAGWKKANVVATFHDFKGQPLMNHRVYLEVQAPNVATQYSAGDVKGGTVIFPETWIKPNGTIRLLAVRLNTPGLVPSGVTHYSLPKNNALKIAAKQKAREVEITATSSEEAATKVGASGTAGVDFKVFSLGGSVSGEKEKRSGQSISQKYKVLIPTETLDIKFL